MGNPATDLALATTGLGSITVGLASARERTGAARKAPRWDSRITKREITNSFTERDDRCAGAAGPDVVDDSPLGLVAESAIDASTRPILPDSSAVPGFGVATYPEQALIR